MQMYKVLILPLAEEDIYFIICINICLFHKCLIKFLLINTILVWIDDPVDLCSIFQCCNSSIFGC